jgi:anti-sigma B factor antagonist
VSDNTLSVEVRPAGQSTSVIDIKGDVTADSEDVLTDAYTEASAQKIRAIILNFTGLDYMNSSGIGLLVTLLVRANRQRQKVIAYGLNEHYRQIFQLTRLDEAISICDDEPTALSTAGAVGPKEEQ